MNEIDFKGKTRIKVDKIEIRDYNLQRIIADTLINNRYDIDITPINDNPNGPQGQELNIYEVRR